MGNEIGGLHHVTALSSDAAANLAFYSRALGLRLVKKTVNFDAPETYHLYYGDGVGTPGTVMTFFPHPGAPAGRIGAGQVALTQFAVPPGSLGSWRDRLGGMGGTVLAEETVFGERRLVVADPDGLRLALVETADSRSPWPTAGTPDSMAVRGFHGATLALGDGAGVAEVLTGLFGYAVEASTTLGGTVLQRFRRPGAAAGILDLEIDPATPPGREGAGTVHHIAFRVPDRAAQQAVRQRIAAAGHRVTEAIDRDYFHAIYFRSPGGVLFEVATDSPGFTTDESAQRLGTGLMLPDQHAHLRPHLEAVLPPLA